MSSLLNRVSYCLRVPSCTSRHSIVYGKKLATWTDRLKRWNSTPQSDNDTSTAAEQSQETSSEASTENEVDENSLAKAVKEKEEIIEKQKTELKELQDKYLRALAETENVRKRMANQVEEARLFGIQVFAKDLLEIADILDRAMQSVDKDALKESSKEFKSLYEGLSLTDAQLQKIFKRNGLEKVDPEGEKFDPNRHEALYQVKGDKPGIVMDVTQVGYILNGRTIRSAKVGIYSEE